MVLKALIALLELIRTLFA
ncbi:damage-inducible type I toxin DinQ [Photorhabdus khanii]